MKEINVPLTSNQSRFVEQLSQVQNLSEIVVIKNAIDNDRFMRDFVKNGGEIYVHTNSEGTRRVRFYD
jgi:hypothetical protein